MKNKVYSTLLAIASLLPCTSAHATLIGDTIAFQLAGPLSASTNVLVQAGQGDQVTLGGMFVVDPEASRINLFNVSAGVLFPNLAGLDGLVVVSGINDTITSFSISTTLVGWNNSRLTFDAHSFTADFRGLTFPQPPSPGPSGFYDAETIAWCINVNPTPDAGSSVVLLAVGILGLAVARRFTHRLT